MKLRKKRRAMNIKLVYPRLGKNERLADCIFSILLSTMLFIGIGGTLLNMFSVSVIGILPIICAAAVSTAYFMLGGQPIKKKLIALGCLFGADISAWAIAFKYARAGFYSVINHIAEVFSIEQLKIYTMFETNVSTAMEKGCTTLFLSLLSPILALLCAYLVQNGFKSAGGVILAVAAVFGSLEAINHSGIWSSLLCMTVALMIIRSLISSGSHKTMPAVCGVIICTCLVAAASLLIFLKGDFTALEQSFSEKRYKISRNIHKMRFEKDSIIRDDGDTVETLMMPEGDFYAIRNELSPSYETTLNITMSNCDEVPSIYLRGYVGEVYTDNGWRQLPKSSLGKYSSLFYQLHKNGFYPQTQLALAADILDSELSDDSLIDVELSPETACKGFTYAPYELYSADSALLDPESLDQARLSAVSSDGYSYKILPNQVKRYNSLDKLLNEQSAAPSERLREYLSLEAKYRSFVYANYTDITEEQQKLLTGYIGEPGVAGQTHISYDEARKKIFHVMADVMEYEEQVESYNGTSSFLRFVLREMQYGYAPHYATITVMMLRHFGIPARYVEGYVITPDDADSAEPGDAISVTDYSAHAWAEYYHDGLGWLPLDTSPNFANTMEGTGAPPEYAAEAPDDSTEQEEETPPEYNKDRNEKEEPPAEKLSSKILPWILLLLILLLMIFGWWYRRMMILKKRRAACDDEDNNTAVCAMMQYMTQLLEVCSIKSHQNTHFALVDSVGESWGNEWHNNFGKAMTVFQKAAYSQHIVSNQEREFVEETLEDMLKMVDSLQNHRNRIKLRYFKCVY